MSVSITNRQLSEHVPRIVHLSLVFSLLMVVVAMAVIRRLAPLDPAPSVLPILRIAAVLQLVIAAVVISKLRGRVPPLDRNDDAAAWWTTNLGRVVIVWALAEGAGMTGAVFWYLTGDLPLLLGVTGVALLILLRMGPSAWAE